MSDDEEEGTRPPPGVWGQQVAGVQFVPVQVALTPAVQQPEWKKSSRSARRRRARAMNKWFRYNMQNNEQNEYAEFDDTWQVPEGGDMAESLEEDVECWPMPACPNFSSEVHDKKTIRA